MGAAQNSYWEKGDQAWRDYRPTGGALPEVPEAHEFTRMGRAAHEALLDIVLGETDGSLRFKNALFFLMYFDNLFVYRDLKRAFRHANASRRDLLAEAARKVLIRCTGWSGPPIDSTRRGISKNTRPERLRTSSMIVELADEMWRVTSRKIAIRDIAVSDGSTSLDMAAAAAERRVPIHIVGTDAWLYVYCREIEGNRVAFNSRGEALQFEIDGQTFRRNDSVPDSLSGTKERLRRPIARG